jgi:hypothetical protein
VCFAGTHPVHVPWKGRIGSRLIKGGLYDTVCFLFGLPSLRRKPLWIIKRP